MPAAARFAAAIAFSPSTRSNTKSRSASTPARHRLRQRDQAHAQQPLQSARQRQKPLLQALPANPHHTLRLTAPHRPRLLHWPPPSTSSSSRKNRRPRSPAKRPNRRAQTLSLPFFLKWCAASGAPPPKHHSARPKRKPWAQRLSTRQSPAPGRLRGQPLPPGSSPLPQPLNPRSLRQPHNPPLNRQTPSRPMSTSINSTPNTAAHASRPTPRCTA